MPADERVSPPSSREEGVRLAEERARELVRGLARERQGAFASLNECRADLEAVALAAVEGLEALAGIAEAFADVLGSEPAVALDTALRGAWERLELAGVVRDGAVGERLDVARHKVVKRRPTAEVAPNTVVQVLSPGLVFRKARLREAAVVVSKAERGDAAYRD